MGSSPAYPSDLTDDQWALIEPLVPVRSTRGKGSRGGRPPKFPRRRIVDAILYLDRTGCSWRQLPHDFPPWETVYFYFQRWPADGTTGRIHDALRDAAGRDPMASAGAAASRRVNTQPVNAACSATGSSRDSNRRKVLACGGSAQTRTCCSATAAQSAIAAYDRAPARIALKVSKRTDCRL